MLGTWGTDDDSRRIAAGLNMAICAPYLGSGATPVPVPTRPHVDAPSGGVFVDPSHGSDETGKGTVSSPFATVRRALAAVRAGASPPSVWLREGTYFEQINVTAADSGVTIASYPGERAVVSGGFDLGKLTWTKAPTGVSTAGTTVYKAALEKPLPSDVLTFPGLFRDGRRLTRARFPNCADITGTSCYTLNASGPAGQSQPRAPVHDLASEPGSQNLEVMNEHGVDMFADLYDSAPATGPHGASDGTVAGNLTIVVQHPDYAWRCHEDCGCVVALSPPLLKPKRHCTVCALTRPPLPHSLRRCCICAGGRRTPSGASRCTTAQRRTRAWT